MTLDRSKIWAGELNRLADETHERTSVGLYDTTLRDGEQTVGVVLTPEDKVEIARALDSLGVDRIEAGFPRVSPQDREAFAAIAADDLSAQVWGFSRAVTADVEALLELGVRAAVIEAPVSDGKLKAYGMTRDRVMERITVAVKAATEAGMTVAFFGVDGSRADLGFLERVYSNAVEAGAREAVMVDTIGVATPQAAALLVGHARTWLGDAVPLHWHGHDDFGLATAAAVSAVAAGASWVHATINGMGERAGNADLIEVAMTLSGLYGYEVALQFDKAREVSELVRRASGYELEPWKPIVGENLFTRESGAVASQFHDPPAIEPFASELVGATRRLVLGKKSGLDSVRIKLEQLGLKADVARHPGLLTEIKELGARKQGLVSDDEFRAMVVHTHD